MPIFTYKCLNDSCKNNQKPVDRLAKQSDKDELTCLECQEKLERQLNCSNFQFNGSGYYCTDFKNNNWKVSKCFHWLSPSFPSPLSLPLPWQPFIMVERHSTKEVVRLSGPTRSTTAKWVESSRCLKKRLGSTPKQDTHINHMQLGVTCPLF